MMVWKRTDRKQREHVRDEIEEAVEESAKLAEKFGLEPFDLDYHVVDYDEMNEYAAYGGYPKRYPHWRWGMTYEMQDKRNRHLPARLYELVINNDPAHAYLQESNRKGVQKLTITHVQAHSDFFANNKAFQRFADGADSVELLAGHADEIEEIMRQDEVSRDAVERVIDSMLVVEDNINQHAMYKKAPYSDYEIAPDEETDAVEEQIKQLNVDEDVKQRLADELDDAMADAGESSAGGVLEEPEPDLQFILREYGKEYDADADKAVEREDWKKRVMDIMRRESYFFAPQKMTKVMNEGWSAYWHAKMMEDESFATQDELIDYAETNASVLSGDPTNPYTLGKHLFMHIENMANRQEVASRLLAVDGVDAGSFDELDYDAIFQELEAPKSLRHVSYESLDNLASYDELVDDANLATAMTVRDVLNADDDTTIASLASGIGLPGEDAPVIALDKQVDVPLVDTDGWRERLADTIQGVMDVERYPWKVLNRNGLAWRHFSLMEPQNRGYLQRISKDDLAELERYQKNQYDSVDEALDAVDYAAGWNRMFEVRENHVDMTFIDSFLTQEFVDEQKLFVYETVSDGEMAMPVKTSEKAEDVRKKLVFEYMNFGKPIVKAYDVNYDNANELLLGHEYGGVEMDQRKARQVLERVHERWGRPVHLKLVEKVRDAEYMERVEEAFQEFYNQKRNNEEGVTIDMPLPEEQTVMLSYDGESFDRQDITWEEANDIAASDQDYKIIPEQLKV